MTEDPTAQPLGAPSVGWSNLADAVVGVWGLGVEGAASLRRLRALGASAVLVDDRPPAPSIGGLRVLETAAGGLDALCTCDIVVKSPGISRYRPEVGTVEASGVRVAGGLGLWLEDADRARVACITGTKGKSTTTAIAGHLLGRLGYRALVCGNLGRPPWDPDVADEWDLWIVELSSFQATDLARAPAVVAVTSLAPDHLDWHGDVERYYRDKLSVCTKPGDPLVVADGSSEELAAHAGLLGDRVRWVSEGDPELDGSWVEQLGLAGRHYRRDALIARAVAVGLGIPEAADAEAVAGAAAGFSALDSRFRPIGTVGGVEFIDDGLSTNVLPTLAALEALADRRVALLVGGHDRGIDYAPLAEGLAARGAPTLVVTLPESGPHIHEVISNLTGAPEVIDADDLRTATRWAFDWAAPDGVVLLSPAAPSFGRFRDYRERSAVFAEAMARCAAAPPLP